MSDIVMYRAQDEYFFRDLHLCFCGRESCSPLHSWGLGVRPVHIIHIVLSGKGLFHAGDSTRELQAGDGFLIEPETPVFYQADSEDPWTYIWVGFSGDQAERMLRKLGLGKEQLVFHCDTGTELEKIVLQMMQYTALTEENDLRIQGELCRFFAALLQGMRVTKKTGTGPQNRYVQQVIELIRNNYFQRLRVEDMAEYVGIHRSYLCTLFKEVTGMSPQQYLANFRLSLAAEMLSWTTYSVETVALSCGYTDPLTFSKGFKKMYGRTPSEYRENSRVITGATLQRDIPQEAESAGGSQ